MPADRDAVDVDLERAAGHRPKRGVPAHPADHGGRVGQVPEDLLGRGGKINLGGEQLTHAGSARVRVIVILQRRLEPAQVLGPETGQEFLLGAGMAIRSAVAGL